MSVDPSVPTDTRVPIRTDPALEMIGVDKELRLGRQPVVILSEITMSVERGEFVAIVGPSGSGKSTMLGIAAGLDRPTRGTVRVDTVDISQMNESQLASIRNQKIGMVFQSFNLIPTLTAQENVEAPLYVGRHRDRPEERAQELLDLVGLTDRLRNRPNQLSGGEQQRVAIARALVTRPTMIVMDEPTGNLDRANGENVLKLIHDLRRRTGTTFIVATHDLEVAVAADRTINLMDGRIVAGVDVRS